MKVIQFPGAASIVAPKIKRMETIHKLLLGSVAFTCSCGAVSDIATHGMVFRTIDFYCQSCGSFHRLTNPAFGNVPIKRK